MFRTSNSISFINAFFFDSLVLGKVGVGVWFFFGYDLSNLAAIEVIARRVELIVYQYRERSREGFRGLGARERCAAVMCGEEADLFDGVGKIAGGACVAPAIVEFVASELEKTAKIDKQSRKAREEKALLQKPTDGPGGRSARIEVSARKSIGRPSSWYGLPRRLKQAARVVVLPIPHSEALPLCSVQWSVSCQNPFHAPRVFSLGSLSVKKTFYRTLYAASTSYEVGACGARTCRCVRTFL